MHDVPNREIADHQTSAVQFGQQLAELQRLGAPAESARGVALALRASGPLAHAWQDGNGREVGLIKGVG